MDGAYKLYDMSMKLLSVGEKAAGDRLGSICYDFSEERRDITSHSEYQSYIHTTQHTPNHMFWGAMYHYALGP